MLNADYFLGATGVPEVLPLVAGFLDVLSIGFNAFVALIAADIEPLEVSIVDIFPAYRQGAFVGVVIFIKSCRNKFLSSAGVAHAAYNYRFHAVPHRINVKKRQSKLNDNDNIGRLSPFDMFYDGRVTCLRICAAPRFTAYMTFSLCVSKFMFRLWSNGKKGIALNAMFPPTLIPRYRRIGRVRCQVADLASFII